MPTRNFLDRRGRGENQCYLFEKELDNLLEELWIQNTKRWLLINCEIPYIVIISLPFSIINMFLLIIMVLKDRFEMSRLNRKYPQKSLICRICILNIIIRTELKPLFSGAGPPTGRYYFRQSAVSSVASCESGFSSAFQELALLPLTSEPYRMDWSW